ncbi:MAG: UvrD-helicase domain-containing protein, partial [Oscillospiraceae bacterium]|nr:UvrD-helicase domain-containing protein [Oscillospiraceae bacterium]
MGVKYTQEQKDAIYGRGGSILVGAAAGSGKTTVLSERIVSMLADEKEPLDASRILVLTFSRAAASDMKQKIKKKLNEAVIADPRNIYLKKQQKLLKRARISTVHSFCAQILREYFSTLGIAPDFSIAEDGFTESIKQRAL